MRSLIVMGVAGCGKSTLGAALAARLGWPLVEGDAHHSSANVAKMHAGVALTDADRQDWLSTLGLELQRQTPVVLTCSALKASYRNLLRQAYPGLGFVFINIDQASAQARVEQRAATHFFSAALVQSQFATLESPSDEPLVMEVLAEESVASCAERVLAWWPAAQAEAQTAPQKANA